MSSGRIRFVSFHSKGLILLTTATVTDLRLSTVRGQILAEDDGRGSSHPDREIRQNGRKDGPSLLMSPNAEEDK